MAQLDISFKPERAHLRRPKAAALTGRVVPQSVSGRYRRRKWTALALCLLIYYALPFLRWDRGPGAPTQAVLIDFDRPRLYFFFIEIWPQEVYYLTGLLILAALALIWINALAGRLWCGYFCPQTVWTDLFLLVERLVEGDRRERLKKQAERLTPRRIAEIAAKHTLWILVALGTGGAFVLYFDDAPSLLADLAIGKASAPTYAWIGVLTATTYILAGHAREQVCIWMCPWPRLQGAVWDPEALIVSYRDYRGEPRGSAKKAAELRARGETAGDCVDCLQCVAVCPIGIDIREGPSFACINCGLCVDACDGVMTKLARPPGLIDYEAWANIERGRRGQPQHRRLVRPKTLALAGAMAALAALMAAGLATRSDAKITVIHERNPVAVTLSDGRIRNAYTVRLSNMTDRARSFDLAVHGLPDGEIEVVGSGMRLKIEPGTIGDARVLIKSRATMRQPLRFLATDAETQRAVSAAGVFIPH